MKKYLAIFLGSELAVSKWKTLDEKKRVQQEKSGMEAWGKWVKANEKSILDHGAPLGKTKRIDEKGISDTKNMMGAYVIIEAESHEAAAKIFEEHPHFMIFPGDSIEVMECLPMPKM